MIEISDYDVKFLFKQERLPQLAIWKDDNVFTERAKFKVYCKSLSEEELQELVDLIDGFLIERLN